MGRIEANAIDRRRNSESAENHRSLGVDRSRPHYHSISSITRNTVGMATVGFASIRVIRVVSALRAPGPASRANPV